MSRLAVSFALLLPLFFCASAPARILWSDPAERTVHHTNAGLDILGGKVRRTGTNSDVLYFKFRVNPVTDVENEPYFAGFQLFEQGEERLGMGNALEAWAYSAFDAAETGPSNRVAGEFNLNSAHPEPVNLGMYRPYELVRHDVPRTIVFKVQYVPGGDDLVTAWLNPKLRRGASEENQPAQLTTKFKARATFDEIRLRHGGGGEFGGWRFSDMAIATSFDDFVVVYFWETWWFNTLAAAAVLVAVGTTVRLVEKRKYQQRLRRMEQESALERERSRIAQDLHDELGSSLTRMSLLSDLVRADKDNPAQVELYAAKLSLSASQTVRSLEEIVWAVRPGSDTLQSLVDYITHFAGELFEGGPTRCRLDVQADLPARTLPPDVRHNIFLIVKETLTNTLKHAAATEVNLQIQVTPHGLNMIVTDNGKGFDVNAAAAAGKRNGLENMRRRARAVGGQLALTSSPRAGTRMEFSVAFPG
ncbi:MAG: sensor histidine kinase [Verrucomicrobiota bacterium]|jgi:signal transduction histidine kinase